jgi:outer membrane protein assembly factor BamB
MTARQNRLRLFAVMTLTLAACAVGLAQVSPRDYLQWRGTDRDGSVSGFVRPERWPDALTRRWRVEVGEGYASPLVFGNLVYVFSRREGREVLSALDAETGATRWQTGYPVSYTPSSPTAAHGSGPKATPLFRDGKIITLGISGIVAGFDAGTGQLLWRGPEPGEAPFFSAASSPAGDGRLAFTHPGNYGPLTAFDLESGKVAWVAGGDAFFMPPTVVTLHGVRQVVSVTQAAVVGVSPENGRVLWEFPWTGGRSGGIMPIRHGDNLILSASASGVIAISPRYLNGSWQVAKAWETTAVEMYISHPVLVGDTLFGFSRRASGQLFALDARDGRVLWLGEGRFATNVAFAKADDLLFILKDDAELTIARANPSRFEPLKTYGVAEGATWAQPVISGQRLFVKDVSTLTLWTFN